MSRVNDMYLVTMGGLVLDSMPDALATDIKTMITNGSIKEIDAKVTCGSVFSTLIPFETLKSSITRIHNRELFFLAAYMMGIESVCDKADNYVYGESETPDEVKEKILDAVDKKDNSSLSNLIKRNVVSAIKKDNEAREKMEEEKEVMAAKISGDEGDEEGLPDDNTFDEGTGEDLEAPEDYEVEDNDDGGVDPLDDEGDGDGTEGDATATTDDNEGNGDGDVEPEGGTGDGEDYDTGLAQESPTPRGDYGIPELEKFPLNSVKRVRSAEAYFNKAPDKYKSELAVNIDQAHTRFGLTKNENTDWYKSYEKAKMGGLVATYGEAVSIRENLRIDINSWADVKKIGAIPKKYLDRILHLRDEISKLRKIAKSPTSSQADKDAAMVKLNMIVSEYNVLLMDIVVPAGTITAGLMGAGIPFIAYGVGWCIGVLADLLLYNAIENFFDDIYETIRGRKKTATDKEAEYLNNLEDAVREQEPTKQLNQESAFRTSDDIVLYAECHVLISTDITEVCKEAGLRVAKDMCGISDEADPHHAAAAQNQLLLQAKVISAALITSFHTAATLGFSCDELRDRISNM